MGVLADSVALRALHSGAPDGFDLAGEIRPFPHMAPPRTPSRARSARPAQAARVHKIPTGRAGGGSFGSDLRVSDAPYGPGAISL